MRVEPKIKFKRPKKLTWKVEKFTIVQEQNQAQVECFDHYRKTLVELTEKAAQDVNELANDETFRRFKLTTLDEILTASESINYHL